MRPCTRSSAKTEWFRSQWRKWKKSWRYQSLILVKDWQLSYFKKQRQWNVESYHVFVTRKMGNLHCCGNILIKWRSKQMQHNATCAIKWQNGSLWYAWSIVECFPIKCGMGFPFEGNFIIKTTMGLQSVISKSMVFFIKTGNIPLKWQQNKIRMLSQTCWKR